MAKLHIGPKQFIEDMKPYSVVVQSIVEPALLKTVDTEKLYLQNRINDLELELKDVTYQLYANSQKTIEIIKEIPVEVIKEVKVIEEKIIEKEVQVIKEFPVIKDKIIKEFVDRPVEVIKEIDKEIIKEIAFIPIWAKAVFLIETLIIIVMLLK